MKYLHLTIVCLSVLLGFLSIAPAQGQHCGTHLQEDPTPDAEAWNSFQQRWQNQRSRSAVQLGITIHVVEGAVQIPIQKLYDELDAINRFFGPSGLQFFFCGAPRFIQGKRNIYTYNQAASELNSRHHVDNTINIFYLDEIGDQQFSQFACGISTFPFDSRPDQRFIIMQKGCSTNGSTLAHEIGHLFGLLHTHETFRGRELVNGSNCMVAGDQLCDTPADPNLGLFGLQGCTYVSNAVDGNGETFRPDPTNIMSYAPAACSNRFTENQAARMNFWYEEELSYLVQNCDHFPDFSISSSENSLNITSGERVDFNFDFGSLGVTEKTEVEVYFSLFGESDDIPTIIHKDTVSIDGGSDLSTVSVVVEFPLTKGTGDYTLTVILDPNSQYLERDKRNNFKEIAVEIDNSQFEDESIFPNPVNDELNIFLRGSQRRGDIFVEISDLYGRSYLSEKRFRKTDEFFTRVDVSGLRAGTYVATIISVVDDKKQSFLILKN